MEKQFVTLTRKLVTKHIKWKVASGIMLILLLIGILTLAFNIQPVKTKDILSETISIIYYFSEPKIHESRLVNEQVSNCVSVIIEDLPQYSVAGSPVLPFQTARVLLPFGTEFQHVKVTEGKKVSLSGSYLVEWGQESVPLNYQGLVEPTSPDEIIYNSPLPFPGELYSDVLVQSKMGYKILLVNLHPVQYIPKTGKLFYYESITVEVDVEPETESESGRLPCRGLIQDREIVEDMVDNPEVVGTYPMSRQTQTYEYVIITNEELEATPGPYNFQALRDEKISRGISATIVTTEWIYANYEGTRPDGGEDNQTKIRNFIIDAYNNWGTRYVLLGGDGDGADVGGESGDAIIPPRGLFAIAYGETDYNISADMYYACLDGTFDYDADGIYGEPNDGPSGGEVDLFAEVYVGRACVDSQTEVQNFVRKTLLYQATTPDSPDLRKVWLVGEYLGFGGVADWGGNYKDEIKEGSDAHGYTTIGFGNSPYASQFDVLTLYDRDWPSNNWSTSEIINIINNNTHLLNHIGHANVGYVMKMVNDDVDSLTNEGLYFIGYSQGCYCGSFDNRDYLGNYLDYDCVSEHLTTQASGAVAFISNSRYGWGELYSTDGASQHYDREFWDAVLGEDIFNIGIANQDSKEDNAGRINNPTADRWCYYQINLFGDPELSIKIEGIAKYDAHEINDEIGGDGDGYPEPGESIEMPVTLHNTDISTDFVNVTATLTASVMVQEVILHEDFEGFWSENWLVYDYEPEGGEDYWGDSNYRAYAGSWSAYCAAVSDVPGQQYDNYMASLMERDIYLSSYDSAILSYYYWLDSEGGFDYLEVGYFDSADNSWHWPKSYTSYVGYWMFDSLSIPTTAIKVGFLFISDSSVTYEGAYIDEVTLTAYSFSPNSYVTVTDDYEEYGNISARDTAVSFDDYDFEIATDCPENAIVIFNLEITADNGGPWADCFEVKIATRCEIYLDPPTITVDAGKNFTVNVNVFNVTDLWAWQFKLKWHPELLEFVDVTEGDFLKSGGETSGISTMINDAEGWILVEAYLYDLVGVNGSGTLANVTFHCIDPGECVLDLCQTRLFNSSPETVKWGYGDADGDGDVDMYDSMIVANAYGSSLGEPRYDPRADFNSDGFVDLFDSLCVYLNYGSLYPGPSNVPVEIVHTDADGWVTQYTIHDVAITNVTPFKTVIGQGYSMSINVTVENQGDFTENFNVTVYANTTKIETQEITLTSINSTTITFSWNTTGFDKGNYTISAHAWQVPNETELSDNTLTNGHIYVACFCDVDANGKVEAKDIALIINAYGKTEKSSGWYAPTWYANYDVDCNGKVEAKDIAYAIANYGNKGC